jgi:hypothetical protein
MPPVTVSQYLRFSCYEFCRSFEEFVPFLNEVLGAAEFIVHCGCVSSSAGPDDRPIINLLPF